MQKKLTLLDGILLVAGSMIGSGIFIVSADIARNVGSAGYLLLAWVIAGAMTIMAAFSYGELSALMPKAGGQYVYLREAYNPLVGFLYGWSLFLVIQTGTIAAVSVAFAKYTGVLFPFFSEKNIAFDLGLLKISRAQLLAIVVVVFLTWLNTRGLKGGSIIQRVFTLAKLAALFGLILIGFFCFDKNILAHNFGDMWNTSARINPNNMGLFAAVGVSMVGTLFSSITWENVTFVSGEMENPTRNVARSMVLGTVLVTTIYLLANIVYLGVLPIDGKAAGTTVLERGIQFAELDRVGTAAVSAMLGKIGVLVMAGLIMISTFGCDNGTILSGARVYQVMAKDGVFFKQAGELNNNGVPGKSLWIQCFWICLLCLSGTYNDLLDYVIFAVLIFYVLTVAGVFILRRKLPNAERPYKAVGYPVLPALYILAALTIGIILLIYKPLYTWPGLLIVLSGIPVYYYFSRRNK